MCARGESVVEAEPLIQLLDQDVFDPGHWRLRLPALMLDGHGNAVMPWRARGSLVLARGRAGSSLLLLPERDGDVTVPRRITERSAASAIYLA